MAAVHVQTASVDGTNGHIDHEAEENWDDDFEFGASGNSSHRKESHSHPRTPRRTTAGSNYAKFSVGSRAETEDWDAEVDHADDVVGGLDTLVHHATSTATLRDDRVQSTPLHALSLAPPLSLHFQPEQETENWDNDFEDGHNSPTKPTSASSSHFGSLSSPSAHSPRPHATSPTQLQHKKEHRESWDDDLESEINDAEFGGFSADHDEEDRTVTARSRRAALSHRGPTNNNNNVQSTPPPPTPKLPRHLTLGQPNVFLAPQDTIEAHTHANSPTSSVFSVPGTVRTTGSGAPLVPVSSSSSSAFPSAALSRSLNLPSSSSSAYPSSSARVFSLLPPSPQVHKERERRRLRKKSRPGDREWAREREGVFELVDVQHGIGRGYSRARASFGGKTSMEGRRSMDSERVFSEEEEDEEAEEDGVLESAHGHEARVVGPPRVSSAGMAPSFRPATAPSPSAQGRPGSPTSGADRNRAQPVVPPTPTKQTLLGRIGSVKRWVGGAGSTVGGIGGRIQARRRGMSTGADGGAPDARHTERPFGLDGTPRNPRPQSSLSSFGNHASASAQSDIYLPRRSQNPSYQYPHANSHYSAHNQQRSPSSPSSPTKSPPGANANTTSNGGGWFFRASSRASSTGSPTSAERRGFRNTSRSRSNVAAATTSTSNSTSTVAAHGVSPTTASPGTRRGKLSKSRSRSRNRVGGRRREGEGGGDRDASYGSHVGVGNTTNSSGVAGLSRRPSSRTAGRGTGMRASLDFSASRTSLGMSMSILEAEERRARGAYTPSPDPSRVLGVVSRRGRGYSIGDAAVGGGGEEERTPAKLVKRKSLGFVQLGKLGGVSSANHERQEEDEGEEREEADVETDGQGSERAAKYGGLGLGRAFTGRGIGEEKAVQEGGEERKRRKSFSRLFKDRDKEQDNEKENQRSPTTPTKEKEGSRGFMGSVRRISLVGRHKRTKSGSGLVLGSVPSSPSSGFFSSSRHASASTTASTRQPQPAVPPLPYSLPALMASESQLSLRLGTSSSTSHLPLPAQLMPKGMGQGGRRIVSTSSSNRSQGSSVVPVSESSISVSASTSASSSRNTSTTGIGNVSGNGYASTSMHQTPTQPAKAAMTRKPSSGRRSRVSEEEGAGVGRPSLGEVGRRSLDFEARIRKSVDEERSVSGSGSGGSGLVSANATPRRPSVSKASTLVPPPMPLLPPIELQPPSPPQTIGPSASGSGGAGQEQSPAVLGNSESLSPTTSSSSLFFTPTSSPHPPTSPNKLAVSNSPGRSPGSQQSASLGRATAVAAAAAGEGGGGGVGAGGAATVPRRNSLGDLKIPARISQAQVSIKRDLGMVREFALSVEQLKEMQQTYHNLVSEVQGIFETHIQQHAQREASPLPRTTSPSFFSNLSTMARPKTRARSNTNPNAVQSSVTGPTSEHDAPTSQHAYKEMASAFYTINSKYRITWECAELLIELGGGAAPSSSTTPVSPPPTSASVPLMHHAAAAAFDGSAKKKSRERAITLAGDQSIPYPTASTSILSPSISPTSPPHIPDATGPPLASPQNTSWRASTGRHDLSHRQLVLLREMLNNANATSEVADETSSSIPEELLSSLHSLHVNRDWRWGDARNSTITLPSEESGAALQDRRASTEKKRRTGMLGMAGIRDMLRALKRSHTETEVVSQDPPPSAAHSSSMAKAVQSTTSLSTQSSSGSKTHRYPHPRLPSNRRRSKTNLGTETVRASKDIDPESVSASPYMHPAFVPPKPSPRRPSLASIFRIGNKNRAPTMSSEDITIGTPPSSNGHGHEDDPRTHSGGAGEDSSSASEEDWDRMDSASDLDAATRALAMGADGFATVRGGSQRRKKGRNPYLQPDAFDPPLPLPVSVPSAPGSNIGYSMRSSIIPKRSFNMSSSSLRNGDPTAQGSPHGSTHVAQRTIRLSNVEELADEPNSPTNPNSRNRSLAHVASPSSTRSKAPNTGSVRSMPPQSPAATGPAPKDLKLAMTPENIKPLLENAKEVLTKLNDCIVEIRLLINQGVVASNT